MATRWVGVILASALGGCVGGTPSDATNQAELPGESAPVSVGRDDAVQSDLRFVGSVARISLRQDFDPFYKWVVVARVESVVEGAYDAEAFAFVVHSPSQEGLEEGGRYEIHVVKTSATAYRFEDAKSLP